MNIIPKPKYMETGELIKGNPMRAGNTIYTNGSKLIVKSLKKQFTNRIEECMDKGSYFVVFAQDFNEEIVSFSDMLTNKEEGYSLQVDSNKVVITAPTDKGLFYGIQSLIQMNNDDIDNEVSLIDWPDNKMRGFHLEARYGIPKFERILEVIDELALYKFNTLLIEYEDKFPFDSHPDIVSANALTNEQISEIQQYAEDRYIDIIPLQQTLGHLEYILKHDRYNHLKEVRENVPCADLPFSFRNVGFKHYDDIDEICASNEDGYKLVMELCEEMALKHQKGRFFHMGCDEAWNLLTCDSCKKKYGEAGLKKLFINHLNKMADKVESLNKIPIIWDDMMRHFDDADFEMLNKNIVVMCWLYFANEKEKALDLVSKYIKHGFKVIGATAAKCSEGVNPLYLDMPYFKERNGNINMWAEVSNEIEIEGIVTTAWSNYTGQIAPPHPFFDTIWYPVIFSADKYWNTKSEKADFEERFISNYFGTTSANGSFENENVTTNNNFSQILNTCKRHKYVAEVYRTMSFLSIYRTKSLAIQREAYKLFNDSSKAEKEIVKKRVDEVEKTRMYVKPLLEELLVRNYNRDDVDEFLDSRFSIDEKLYKLIKAQLDEMVIFNKNK